MTLNKKSVLKISALTSVITLASLNVQAALYDRGNGMIYDSALNITWLQDANYAKTSGYDANGLMTWEQATAWAGNLVYGGYSDWRLASAGLNGTNFVCNECTGFYEGTYDVGFNNTRSEMGHLFIELGNQGLYSTTGVVQYDYGLMSSSFNDAATHQSVSFLNIQNWVYWEAEAYALDPSEAWFFNNAHGGHSFSYKYLDRYAWAVRDGDVAAVPVPGAIWLMGSALIGLASLSRRKNKV